MTLCIFILVICSALEYFFSTYTFCSSNSSLVRIPETGAFEAAVNVAQTHLLIFLVTQHHHLKYPLWSTAIAWKRPSDSFYMEPLGRIVKASTSDSFYGAFGPNCESVHKWFLFVAFGPNCMEGCPSWNIVHSYSSMPKSKMTATTILLSMFIS